MDWIESLGGPLVLMEASLLPFWEGANVPSGGRLARAESRASQQAVATDYDRACDVRRVLGVLEVGPGVALVLGGEPLPTAWWPEDELRGGTIVRWMYAPNEDAISGGLAHLPVDLFAGPALRFEVDGPMVLFDSAMPGHEITTHSMEVRLSPGSYTIKSALYRPDDEMSLLLHRLRRAE